MQTLAVRYAAQKTGQTINTALGHSNLDYHGEKIDALHDQNSLLAPFVHAFHQAFSVYPQQEQQ